MAERYSWRQFPWGIGPGSKLRRIGIGGRAGLFAAKALTQAVEENVDDWRGVEREDLADQEPTHHSDAQRTAQFRAQAAAERQGQSTQQRGHGGHHDGTKTQQAGLINRIGGIFAM